MGDTSWKGELWSAGLFITPDAGLTITMTDLVNRPVWFPGYSPLFTSREAAIDFQKTTGKDGVVIQIR